jgi:hypothetical protein
MTKKTKAEELKEKFENIEEDSKIKASINDSSIQEGSEVEALANEESSEEALSEVDKLKEELAESEDAK